MHCSQFFDAGGVLGGGELLDLLLTENVELLEDVIADGSLGCSESGGQSIRSQWR